MRAAAGLLEQLARSEPSRRARSRSSSGSRIGAVIMAVVFSAFPLLIAAVAFVHGLVRFDEWRNDRGVVAAPQRSVSNRTAANSAVPARPRDHLTDRAGILNAGAAVALNGRLAQFERETTNQLLVYVDRSLPPRHHARGARQLQHPAVGSGAEREGQRRHLLRLRRRPEDAHRGRLRLESCSPTRAPTDHQHHRQAAFSPGEARRRHRGRRGRHHGRDARRRSGVGAVRAIVIDAVAVRLCLRRGRRLSRHRGGHRAQPGAVPPRPALHQVLPRRRRVLLGVGAAAGGPTPPVLRTAPVPTPPARSPAAGAMGEAAAPATPGKSGAHGVGRAAQEETARSINRSGTSTSPYRTRRYEDARHARPASTRVNSAATPVSLSANGPCSARHRHPRSARTVRGTASSRQTMESSSSVRVIETKSPCGQAGTGAPASRRAMA